MERLDHEYVVLQTDESRAERLATLMEELVQGARVINTFGKLVFCCVPDTQAFLKWAFQHELLYRSVHRYYSVQWKSPTLDWTFLASLASPLEDNVESYRLMVFPKEEEHGIINAVPNGVNLHPKTFSHLACIIHVKPDEWYFGILSPQFLYSPENSPFHSRDPSNAISRAHYKLKEALERANLRSSPLSSNSIAADVGAAPGGISIFLAQNCKKVYAIDPADMLVSHDNLVHLKLKVEDACSLISDPLDLLVCDMNIKVERSMEMLIPLQKNLRCGGALFLTMKFMNRGNIQKKVDAATEHFKQLYPEFEIVKILFLITSSKLERMLIAVKK